MHLIIDIVLVIGGVIILLLLLLLFNAKQKGTSQKLLIFIFTITFFLNLNYYSVLHNIKSLTLTLFTINAGIGFILGPLILFYVRSLFVKKINLKKLIFHLIPLFIYSLLFTIPYLISVIKKTYAFNYLEILDSHLFRFYLNIVYLAIYILTAQKEYNKYQKHAKNNYSNLESAGFKTLTQQSLIFLIESKLLFSF
jgi:tryptophan-rich sensory protein